MDGTWHARPRGSAREPTWRLRGARYLLIYIVYNIICSAFRISEGNLNPLKPLFLINPTISLNFSRVELSSTRFLFKTQDTWRKGRRRICGTLEIRTSIAWTRGPPIKDHACAFKMEL